MKIAPAALLVFVIFSSGMLQAADLDPAGADFFEKKIRPVLVQNCYKCHSTEAEASGKLKGGLMVDSRDAIRRGGDSGPAIVPSDIKKSLLISAIKHDEFEMPPKTKLANEVIADFEKWVAMGAPDPRVDEVAAGPRVIDIEKGREFWCFQPVTRTDAPKVKDASWPRGDIDRFVLAPLEEKGLRPVADADARALVRRLYFDLTGLPPTIDEIKTFEQSSIKNQQSAIGNLVDQLLDSPQFGERWGRHWLDVARYAESNGNTRNATFPHAWRYRDYVIDALNRDTPYDRFITEQIAGDLLPADSADERNRNRVATGFLALASKPVIRGKGGAFVADVADDQIEVTSRAVLGLTVACARCHDHKFDPIPTTDYYALAGIFASSDTLYGGGGNTMGAFAATGLHELESRDPDKAQAFDEWKKQVADLTARQKDLRTQIKKLQPKAKTPKKAKPVEEDAKQAERTKQLAELTAQANEVAAELKKLQGEKIQAPGSAMGVRESGKVNEVPVYVRGETPKGAGIPRGVVAVVTQSMPAIPADQSGRAELAKWLTSPDNPLTSRVIVNRIWLHLFGEGLVRTPDNFGINGDLPSHPELLDWLADDFVKNGWSMKKMIRQIMLSRTYQLSNAHDDRNYEADPDNVLLWRHTQRRLEAEAIRDAMLASSGQLQTERPAGSPVTKFNETLIQDALTPDKIHEPSNHRSIYLPMLRNGLPEMMETFDVADPSLVVGQRNVTTVPSQDLYLMNSPFVVEQSQHFAKLLLAANQDDVGKVELAYRRTLSRMPSDEERNRALAFVHESLNVTGDADKADDKHVADAWAGLCQALFVTAEFRHMK